MKQAKLKLKAVLAILLLVDFIILLSTGIMMYAGIGPEKISNLHTVAGFLMGLLATIHIILNFRMLIGELTGKIEICFKQK